MCCKGYGLHLYRETLPWDKDPGVLLEFCTSWALDPNFACIMQRKRCDKVRFFAIALIGVQR